MFWWTKAPTIWTTNAKRDKDSNQWRALCQPMWTTMYWTWLRPCHYWRRQSSTWHSFLSKNVLSTRCTNLGNNDGTTPNMILNNFEEARQTESTQFLFLTCHTTNLIQTCPNCEPDEAMPAVHELLREIPDDDEGGAERTTEGDCNVYTEIWVIHPTGCSFKY